MFVREYTPIAVTIGNGEALSETINMKDFSGGIVIIPSAWTDANLGFKVSPTPDGTFVILHSSVGVPVQIGEIVTNASYAYAIPEAIFAAGFMKLWSKNTTDATVTDTNQGAARNITVLLKS
jgi:hypothetical protein